MTCPTCQTKQPQPEPNQQPPIFCIACDAALLREDQQMKCQCGRINKPGAKICLTCGSKDLEVVGDELPF